METKSDGPSMLGGGRPGSRPSRSGLSGAAIAAVLLVVVGLFVGGWFLFSGDDEATAGGDGSLVLSGEAEGERRLKIVLPKEVMENGNVSIAASGETGALEPGRGGAIVAVYIAPKDDLQRACPKVRPAAEDADGWDPLLFSVVYGAGPFLTAANRLGPAGVGQHRICGWVEPLGGYGVEDASSLSTLAASGELRVTEYVSDPASLERLTDEVDEDQPLPGVYAAEGRDLVGVPTGTRVEFELRAGEFAPDLVYVAATNFPTGRCDAAGKPVLGDAFSDRPEDPSFILHTEATMKPELALGGGSAKPGEFHGMLGRRFFGGLRCPGHVSFIAHRVKDGKRPLRAQLKK